MVRLPIAAAILLMYGHSAKAVLLWNWSYSGAGVSASGTFTTNDAPGEAGVVLGRHGRSRARRLSCLRVSLVSSASAGSFSARTSRAFALE